MKRNLILLLVVILGGAVGRASGVVWFDGQHPVT